MGNKVNKNGTQWKDGRFKLPLTERQQEVRTQLIKNAIAASCEAFGVTEQAIMFSQARKNSTARQAVVLFLRENDLTHDEIKVVFGKDRSTIIRSIDLFVMKMMSDGRIRSQWLDMYANYHRYKKLDKAEKKGKYVHSLKVIDRTAEVRDERYDEAGLPRDIFDSSN